MRRLAILVACATLPAAAGCGRRLAANYKHCLKLRVGMTREDMLKVMGAPDETIPFVEGKSLDYLRGRTAYEWSNPATMPGPDHVSVEEATGKIASIRCSNAEISASVFVEPPEPSTAAAVAPVPEPVAARPEARTATDAPAKTAAPTAKKASEFETLDLPEAVVSFPKGWKVMHVQHPPGVEGKDTTFQHAYYFKYFPGMKESAPKAWADALISRSTVPRKRGVDGTLRPTFDELRAAIDCKYTGPRFGLTACSHPLSTVTVAGVTGYAFLDDPSELGGHAIQSSVVAFEKDETVYMIVFTASRDSFGQFFDEFQFITSRLQIKPRSP